MTVLRGRSLLLVILAGCGRLSFDALGDDDGGRDAGIDDDGASGLLRVNNLEVGGKVACATLEGQEVWCWGDNSYGGLASPTSLAFSTTPVRIPVALASVDVNDGGVIGTALDGRVYAWGANHGGQLGPGTAIPQREPIELVVPFGTEELAMGDDFLCVRHGGKVSCAGAGDMLADGIHANRRTLEAVTGIATAVRVAAGNKHACVLLSNGTVTCWGQNQFGQLGTGTVGPDELQPTMGPSGPYVDLVVGDWHTCAVRQSDQGVECWGDNSVGALGSSVGSPRPLPAPVGNVGPVAQLAAGAAFTCGLSFDLSLACWGQNENGAITSDESTGWSSGARAVTQLANVRKVASRTDVAVCALSGERDVYCWGRNEEGTTGDPSLASFNNVPRLVTGLP